VLLRRLSLLLLLLLLGHVLMMLRLALRSGNLRR
jgi:hypothetical protein